MKTAAALALLTALTVPLHAQIESDPRQKMQEILDELAQEMKQIDKWLQESSRTKDAAKGMRRNMDRMHELLDSVGKSQKQVVKNIDDLLKETQRMKEQGKGQPQDSEQSQKQRQQQQRDRERQRSGRQPRRLQRPQQNQQQQPDAEKKNGTERNNRPEVEKGENVGSRAPKKGATEIVDGKKLPGAWGGLPDYILKHGRGSMPEVPEKYRKYLEAITKQGDQKKRK